MEPARELSKVVKAKSWDIFCTRVAHESGCETDGVLTVCSSIVIISNAVNGAGRIEGPIELAVYEERARS